MKDAAGRTPATLTSFEKKWHASVKDGTLQKRYDELVKRQELSLEEKISISMERIHEWYQAFDGKVAVSFSGGKDSSVLLWLVRQAYPDVPAVFCNTGLEYPEIYSIIKNTDNVTIVRPKIPFHHIIRDYGWPVISKKVALGINVLKNPTANNQNIWRLYDQGINRFGKPVNGFKVAKRWRFLINAPFPIRDKCCQIMKKDPMHRYEKETGRAQFVGMMAADSKGREKVYLQTGCNAFDAKSPRSMPMGFWTEQDVLKTIRTYNIPYAGVYGNINKSQETGQLFFDGVHSTGCIFCCFGLHMESAPNRFQQLAITLIDAHAHELIRAAYRKPTGNGEIRDLAGKLGVPRWKVTRYAQKHAWTKRTKKMPDWSTEEIKVLKRHARHCPEKIQRELKKAGYARTVVGIVLKRKRLRLSIQSLEGYSASSLAMCLGEDSHFVTNAIKSSELLATRRETNRTAKQGGDIFWIKPKDARRWILENVNRIDLTKVDKHWFVDFVSGAGI